MRNLRISEIFELQYSKCFYHFFISFTVTLTAWKVSIFGVFSSPHFPVFSYGDLLDKHSLRIHSEYGKIRTRKNSVFGHFSHSVCTCTDNLHNLNRTWLQCELWFLIRFEYTFYIYFDISENIRNIRVKKFKMLFLFFSWDEF